MLIKWCSKGIAENDSDYDMNTIVTLPDGNYEQMFIGSTNAFARRAIARRAVTTVVNNGVKKNCVCVPQPVKNLKGKFHN